MHALTSSWIFHFHKNRSRYFCSGRVLPSAGLGDRCTTFPNSISQYDCTSVFQSIRYFHRLSLMHSSVWRKNLNIAQDQKASTMVGLSFKFVLGAWKIYFLNSCFPPISEPLAPICCLKTFLVYLRCYDSAYRVCLILDRIVCCPFVVESWKSLHGSTLMHSAARRMSTTLC